MFDPMDKRKQLITAALLMFVIFAAVICCYYVFSKRNHKTPSKGFFVEAFKTQDEKLLQ